MSTRDISTLPLDALGSSDHTAEEVRFPSGYNVGKDRETDVKIGQQQDGASLSRVNERLIHENDELRRCVYLLKENCELRTASVMASLLSMCDDRLRAFHMETLLSNTPQLHSQTRDSGNDMTPSYGGSFKTVGYSELASPVLSGLERSYRAPPAIWTEERTINKTNALVRKLYDNLRSTADAKRGTLTISRPPELRMNDLVDYTGSTASSRARSRSPKQSSRSNSPKKRFGDVLISTRQDRKSSKRGRSPEVLQPPMRFSMTPNPMEGSGQGERYSPTRSPVSKGKYSGESSGERKSRKSTQQSSDTSETSRGSRDGQLSSAANSYAKNPDRQVSPMLKERLSSEFGDRRRQRTDNDTGDTIPDMTQDSLEPDPSPDHRHEIRQPVLDGRMIRKQKYRETSSTEDPNTTIDRETDRLSTQRQSTIGQTATNRQVLNDTAHVQDVRDATPGNVQQVGINRQSSRTSIDLQYKTDIKPQLLNNLDNQEQHKRTRTDVFIKSNRQPSLSNDNDRGPVRGISPVRWEEERTPTDHAQVDSLEDRDRQEPGRYTDMSRDQGYNSSLQQRLNSRGENRTSDVSRQIGQRYDSSFQQRPNSRGENSTNDEIEQRTDGPFQQRRFNNTESYRLKEETRLPDERPEANLQGQKQTKDDRNKGKKRGREDKVGYMVKGEYIGTSRDNKYESNDEIIVFEQRANVPLQQGQTSSKEEYIGDNRAKYTNQEYDHLSHQRPTDSNEHRSKEGEEQIGDRGWHRLREELPSPQMNREQPTDFGVPLASSTPIATRSSKYSSDNSFTESTPRYGTAPMTIDRMMSFSSENITEPNPRRLNDTESLTGSRSYEILGRPVAQSTPRNDKDEYYDRPNPDSVGQSRDNRDVRQEPGWPNTMSIDQGYDSSLQQHPNSRTHHINDRKYRSDVSNDGAMGQINDKHIQQNQNKAAFQSKIENAVRNDKPSGWNKLRGSNRGKEYGNSSGTNGTIDKRYDDSLEKRPESSNGQYRNNNDTLYSDKSYDDSLHQRPISNNEDYRSDNKKRSDSEKTRGWNKVIKGYPDANRGKEYKINNGTREMDTRYGDSLEKRPESSDGQYRSNEGTRTMDKRYDDTIQQRPITNNEGYRNKSENRSRNDKSSNWQRMKEELPRTNRGKQFDGSSGTRDMDRRYNESSGTRAVDQRYDESTGNRAIDQRYNESSGTRAVDQKYNQSSGTRAVDQIYNESSGTRAVDQRYDESSGNRAIDQRYNESSGTRAVDQKYNESSGTRAVDQRYNESSGTRAVDQRYNESSGTRAIDQRYGKSSGTRAVNQRDNENKGTRAISQTYDGNSETRAMDQRYDRPLEQLADRNREGYRSSDDDRVRNDDGQYRGNEGTRTMDKRYDDTIQQRPMNNNEGYRSKGENRSRNDKSSNWQKMKEELPRTNRGKQYDGSGGTRDMDQRYESSRTRAVDQRYDESSGNKAVDQRNGWNSGTGAIGQTNDGNSGTRATGQTYDGNSETRAMDQRYDRPLQQLPNNNREGYRSSDDDRRRNNETSGWNKMRAKYSGPSRSRDQPANIGTPLAASTPVVDRRTKYMTENYSIDHVARDVTSVGPPPAIERKRSFSSGNIADQNSVKLKDVESLTGSRSYEILDRPPHLKREETINRPTVDRTSMDYNQRHVSGPSTSKQMPSFDTVNGKTPSRLNDTEPLTGSRSYEILGRPVAQSTVRERKEMNKSHPSTDSVSNTTIARVIGYQGNGALEKTTFIFNRPVDVLIEYNPNITQDMAITLAQATPNRRFVGEIAFQLDRRIIEYIFAGVWKDDPNRKRTRFSLINIIPMIEKEIQAEGINSKQLEDKLMGRLETIINKLKPFGYTFETHARFTQTMVNTYGLLNSAPDASTVDAFGLDDPAVLRILIGQILKDGNHLYDMLIVMDCLCFLAYLDKLSLFIW